MDFVQEFGSCAEKYKEYRPFYPQSLFQWISSFVIQNASVLDCGAGNGQATVQLAQYFDRIIAIDASEKQINSAQKHNNISYACMPAESIRLPDLSLILLLVLAQYTGSTPLSFTRNVSDS